MVVTSSAGHLTLIKMNGIILPKSWMRTALNKSWGCRNKWRDGTSLEIQWLRIKTCILPSMKQITSPDWMHETSAPGWCTGKTQRDRVEREVGRGIGMGNTCKSMADSCQCMTKPLQYCKVISLQLIEINGKKKKTRCFHCSRYRFNPWLGD